MCRPLINKRKDLLKFIDNVKIRNYNGFSRKEKPKNMSRPLQLKHIIKCYGVDTNDEDYKLYLKVKLGSKRSPMYVVILIIRFENEPLWVHVKYTYDSRRFIDGCWSSLNNKAVDALMKEEDHHHHSSSSYTLKKKWLMKITKNNLKYILKNNK